MSVCQYNLRGTCRYGNRCRLSHVEPNESRAYYPNNPSFRPRHPRPTINPNYNYVAPSAANKTQTVENTTTSRHQNSKYAGVFAWAATTFSNKEKALDILQQLQKEARVWLKSEHFWRFTSRSLFPGGQPLPDWQDYSFEEIHLAYQFLMSQNQEHIFTKNYYDYIAKTERHLSGLSQARLETLIQLKDHINEYVLSNYQPSATLPTDIEMKDVNNPITSNFLPSIQSNNYTPEDQLLEDERAAFESDTFEFGQIPVHAPSRQFC